MSLAITIVIGLVLVGLALIARDVFMRALAERAADRKAHVDHEALTKLEELSAEIRPTLEKAEKLTERVLALERKNLARIR